MLSAREEVYRHLDKASGWVFDPELVTCFRELSAPESFWLDLVSPFLAQLLADEAQAFDSPIEKTELKDLAEFFASVIDARSRFTYLHSRRVAELAAALAARLGMSAQEQEQARVAGLLHDLGKVRVPEEVLEKPGSLTREEFDLIKEHTFYTYRILRAAGDLSPLAEWAAYHHERLDGQGYPFRLKGGQLDLGARLLAVAEVFVPGRGRWYRTNR